VVFCGGRSENIVGATCIFLCDIRQGAELCDLAAPKVPLRDGWPGSQLKVVSDGIPLNCWH